MVNDMDTLVCMQTIVSKMKENQISIRFKNIICLHSFVITSMQEETHNTRFKYKVYTYIHEQYSAKIFLYYTWLSVQRCFIESKHSFARANAYGNCLFVESNITWQLVSNR